MAQKPNKKSTVNKVKKTTQGEPFNLSSGAKELEDEVKRPRKKSTQLDTGKHTRVKAPEEQPIKKGRPVKAKEVKEPKDRHTSRKSEIAKEYTAELQKLRNRLKYREKQGFFVKWETLPTNKKNVTAQDLERLKQYDIRLNENNEIEMYRKEYSQSAQDETQKLRIKYQDRPNYTVENDPNFVPPDESVQHFDVFDRIEHTILYDMGLVETDGAQLDHPLQEDKWISLSNEIYLCYENALQVFRSNRDSPNRQAYADYLWQHEDEVCEAIDALLYVSNEEQLAGANSEMLRYLEYH